MVDGQIKVAELHMQSVVRVRGAPPLARVCIDECNPNESRTWGVDLGTTVCYGITNLASETQTASSLADDVVSNDLEEFRSKTIAIGLRNLNNININSHRSELQATL